MTRAWDQGIQWYSRRTVNPTTPVLSVAYVRDKVLRVANDDVDDEFIGNAIEAASALAEEWTGLTLTNTTWEQIHSGFPGGPIELLHLPLIGILSFAYVDEDGVTQTLAGSPAEYRIIPSGQWRRAQVTPLYDASWPTTRCQPDAVTITYTAGHASLFDPALQRIKQGIGLLVGELYNHRTLSVHEIQNLPTVIGLQTLWARVF